MFILDLRRGITISTSTMGMKYMDKSDEEKTGYILDEHERIFRKQASLYTVLGILNLIICLLCVVATFCVSVILPESHLKYQLFSFTILCMVCSFIIYYYTRHMVLNRQELLRLMRLTEGAPDVKQELLNRLLSGKILTYWDEKDIRRLIF